MQLDRKPNRSFVPEMPSIQLQIVVPETLDGSRLDQALVTLFPQYSRSQHQNWIKKGQVTVDEQTHRPKDKVHTDQTIKIAAELTVEDRWEAQDIPLNIIYEDEDIIIIDKPVGLVVHPGAGNPDKTLVNALLYHDSKLNTLPRAGIIHRLDKDTAGLLVIARSLEAHNTLVKAMQAREIKREYEAIVQGVMISGGTIEAPIARHPKHRTQMAIVQSGKPAVTHYRIIKKYRAHTHLRIQLETGRTHQIRVHFQHINYPLIGDKTYIKRLRLPSGVSENLKKAITHFPRQALHATQLELSHPISGKVMRWESPLPEDLKNLIAALQTDLEENSD